MEKKSVFVREIYREHLQEIGGNEQAAAVLTLASLFAMKYALGPTQYQMPVFNAETGEQIGGAA